MHAFDRELDVRGLNCPLPILRAKKMLGDGIVSAKRTGNAHAQSEMEGMLADLG